MAYGEFVGNQSVHWRIDHETGQDMQVDPTDDPPKGDKVHIKKKCQGRDPKRVKAFAVRLRFDTMADAQKAFDEALKGRTEAGGDVYVTVSVRALERRDAAEPPDPEVRVSW